ncbi:CBS domain-containing protein [Vineibacter terrae]|uniref:CBS domain-containing protein n=1 Tax=Vineibacter terrae TaxID=2586908 RepID=UPI002E31029A|nr:CBS domain-containing protein [Vineibacter terrae]HEX2885670.1 CBS domain-containing protein [Vineibacter terrae]
MLAKDVMTRQVHTVTPATSIFDLAQLLLGAQVSAVPVVDADGTLLGIVSEADLVHRVELGTERERSWLLRLVSNDASRVADYIKSHARRVADIMTASVVTVAEDTPLAEIARLMDKHHVKCIPVVRDGRPVGTVSRANLLQGLLAHRPAQDVQVTDEAIRSAIADEFAKNHWPWIWPANVVVEQGVVHLWGYVHNETVKKVCGIAAEQVAGVKRVENHLVVLPEVLAFGV